MIILHSPQSCPARRGAIAPLIAVFMPVFLAMVAFMVDTGYIVETMTELQNAADSAALAGASQLVQPVASGYSTDSLSASAVVAAKAQAKAYCALNSAGGVYLQLADSDITVGYQSTPGGAVVPWSNGQPFPNAVQVTVRRDSTLNSPLALFFGPAIGTPTWSGQATATAATTFNRYQVTGFNTTSNGTLPLLLPIGVDASYVAQFLATGQSPDGTVHDNYSAVIPYTGMMPPLNVSNGGDHIPELYDSYPDKNSPGNFGLVNLNYTNPSNNSPQFVSWILNGPSATDIASFGSNGFQATAASPTIVKGGPGLKSTLVTDLNSIIGQQRILPIFSSVTGQGSNTYYTIVGFLGVTVVQAQGHGSNEDIAFQPMPVVDPTATITTPGSSSSSTTFVYQTLPIALNN